MCTPTLRGQYLHGMFPTNGQPLPRLILLAGIMLSACTQTMPSGSDCDWAQPIRPSRQDILSEGTMAQIVAHNAVGEQVCGWQP